MVRWLSRLAWAFIALLTIGATRGFAQTATTPSAIRAYSTIHSIGIEWDVLGDTNHDAAVAVDYRVQNAAAWMAALPLVRVDFNGANTLSGSVLFLTPNTTYEVRLSLTDPDGGADTRIVTIRTRALPALPATGRKLQVIPGTGGGDGSAGNPFRGIAAAQAVAQPGDTFLLHAGDYGGRIRFDKAGSAASYIVWREAGDGEVLINGIDVAASHIWLEGLAVRNQASAIVSFAAPDDIVIRRCNLQNNHYSIYLNQGGTNWYIADNTIVGDTPYNTESLDGEGIELNHTTGHTVAHNAISSVADGISYPTRNVDIFGNDIFDTSDDGVEADSGFANVRIWGNRIHNAVHNGISFQPQNGGPWYIVRNQIASNVEAAFKFRTTDRFVLLHNTIVNWGTAWPGDAMMCCNEDHLMRAIARNNLWISIQGGQIWGFDAFTKDWRSDLDYDGFDWGSATNPFSYGGVVYADLASFAAASGLERNGFRVVRGDCFDTFDVPNPPMNLVPPQAMTLKAGCNAIDAGAVLPNINDGAFSGSAPDLGAYEYGRPPQEYGPREAPGGTITAPTAPAGLAATAVSSSRIDVSWSDTSANEDGFTVEQSTDGVSFSPVATVGANVMAWSATGLAAATTYTYRVRAFNSAGPSPYSATASATTAASASGTIVIWASEVPAANLHGNWRRISDASAAGGIALHNPNAAQAKVAPALANPTNYFEATFTANAGTAYHLWVRLKAENNSTSNDSVHIQFSDSLSSSGGTTMRIGSTSSAELVLQDGSADTSGLHGWGWTDNGWGTPGVPIYFASTGRHTLRVQQREDGAIVDQIVLSPDRYVSSAPGPRDNDTTILASTTSPASPPSNTIVLWAANVSAANVHGNWQRISDTTAAGGTPLHNPDAAQTKVAPALANPTNYFEATFTATAGTTYHIWVRLRAQNNSTANDSVHIQFNDTITSSGAATMRIGSTSSAEFVLQDGSTDTSGHHGWGWTDNGWGVPGTPIYFATTGTHTLRVQQREDGAVVDQIVISPDTYLSSAPGPRDYDTTILPASSGGT